jgi:hypothetical protein
VILNRRRLVLAPPFDGLRRARQYGPVRWRIVAVSSSGGVLLDLLALRPWLSRHDVTWVAPPAPDTDVLLDAEDVRWESERTVRQVGRLPGDVVRAARALRAAEADCVVSAGTGLAVAWFSAATLLGVPRVWVDTLNFVDRPGRVARLCGRMASVVLSQAGSPDRARRRAVPIGLLY